MADFTLNTNYHFVSGDIGAYPASRWAEKGTPSGAPIGTATDEQTISGGSVTFTGLTAGTSYYATDATGTKYVQFTVPSTSLPTTTPAALAAAVQTELDEQQAYTDAVAAGGIELGYAGITADVTQTGSGNQDVAGLSVTVTVGSRPIIVQVGAKAMANSSASGVAVLSIKESTTTLATINEVLSTFSLPVFRSVRLAPSAGSHTYKVNLQQLVTGNVTLSAGATDPAFIQVIEI